MADRCHFCGYNLSGLPDRHKCPECAFAYDHDAEVIMQSQGGPVAYTIFGALGALMFLADWPKPGQGALTNVLRLGFPVVFIGFLIYGWRCLRQRNRAILSPDGLCLLGRFNSSLQGMRRESWRAAWPEIGAVRWKRTGMGIAIVDPAGGTMMAVEADFFGSSGRAREFVERANSWLESTRPRYPIADGAATEPGASTLP